jgi:putative polyketide hydroxylase
MSSWVADRFRAGRVLLAGDAAHTMPPTGGLGGQTAMQDAYDLAWKLALVLQGHADAALLESYEEERSHAAELTVALQTANYVARIRPDRQEELLAKVRPEDYLAIAASCRHRSAAISLEGDDDGAPAESPLHPTGTPGTRAAHVVLEHRGARISSIDLIGRDFVLVCGPEGTPWARAATALRYEHGVPLSIYRIGADLLDVEGVWAERLGVTASGAVLLRPDGYIAWRSRTLQRSPDDALRGALARALCRPAPSFGTAGQAAA